MAHRILTYGVGAIAAVASTGVGLAQDQAAVQSWLDSQWELARGMPPSNLVMIRWHMADVYVPKPAELTELRRLVGSSPNAPQRTILERYDAVRAGSPPTSEWTLWSNGDVLRMNCTSISPKSIAGAFADIAVNGDVSWAMSAEGLDIQDTANPDPGFDRRQWSNVMKNQLALLLTSGISHAATLHAPAPVVVVSGSQWVGRTEPKNGWQIEVRGGWNRSDERGFISELSVLPASGDPNEGVVYRSYDVQHRDVVNLHVPSRVEQFVEGNRMFRTYAYHSAEQVTADYVERLVKVPEPGTPDVIRGVVSPTITMDLRSGVRLQTTRDQSGVSTLAIPPSRLKRECAWLRTSGWVCCGCIIAALVALRLRRSAATQ
ncbi:MAG: hypothetical protein IT438_08090 [Phycisphaerales bacterium]|nr:hypothetical protein [Phycisphaerales bacterium]